MNDGVLLDVRDLTVEFFVGGEWVPVVANLDVSVRSGQVVGLVGESGSGKSVTCYATMGLVDHQHGRVTGGEIVFDGRDLRGLTDRQMADLRGNELAMIFQEPMTSLNPAFTIGQQISEVVRRHRGVSRREARRRAIEVLDVVGIPWPADRLGDYPHQFSGGMRQRVMTAMALATEPRLLIADEPTTALDVTIQAQILELLRGLADDLDLGVLLVTHDLGVVADVCDDVVVMYAGQVVEHAECFDLFARPQHPYSSALMQALPRVDRPSSDADALPGLPPLAGHHSAGCRLAPRCRFAIDACRAQPVPLMPRAGGGQQRCLRASDISTAVSA